MKILRSVIKGLGLATLLGCMSEEESKTLAPPKTEQGGCKSNKSFVPYINDEQINAIRKEFIDKKYEQIAREQKEKFNLGEFIAPIYKYEAVHSDSFFVDVGVYDYATGYITFNISNSVKKYGNASEQLFEVYNCIAITPKEIEAATDYNVRHELGHAYFYEEVRKQQKSEWFHEEEGGYTNRRNVHHGMITEGFGEYMAAKGTPYPKESQNCNDEKMKTVPTDYNSMFQYNIYDCGLTLVSPILDKDFRKGLYYLLTHPPQEKDINDLVAWQKHALKEVGRE